MLIDPRICSKCREPKPLSEFWKNSKGPGGRAYLCKVCMEAANKKWRSENKDRRNAWARNRRRLSGKTSTEAVRLWRFKNPERSAEHNAPSERRRAMDRARYANNPERRAAVNRRFKELNNRRPEIKNAITARRRSKQKSALVPWGDKKKVRAIYAEAARLQRETGVKHHVDHVVPLQSPIVCGLHWEGNLQVLPAAENHAKLNRHWPDMPGAAGAY